METSFCFRVDIDTWKGIHKGLPQSINLATEFSIPTTFYLSLGRYATGKNLFRIIQNREPIKRKTPVWRRNHWSDLFRGILLPSKQIDKNTMYKIRGFESNEYSEFHPHGYNHVTWANEFNEFNFNNTSEYLDLMIQEYIEIFGRQPIANAAPNFVVNPFYLKLLAKKSFKFASDFIYHSPFSLSLDNKNEKMNSILQLPVTEETIEGLIAKGKDQHEIVEFYKQRFREIVDKGITYVCLYSHAIYEPLKLRSVLEGIFELTFKYDMKPLTHSEFYSLGKQYPTISLEDIIKETHEK